MKDDSAGPGDASAPGPRTASAPGLSAAADRAAFQPELDQLRVREKARTREGDAIAAPRLAAGRSDDLGTALSTEKGSR
jgi:hypothetical protein